MFVALIDRLVLLFSLSAVSSLLLIGGAWFLDRCLLRRTVRKCAMQARGDERERNSGRRWDVSDVGTITNSIGGSASSAFGVVNQNGGTITNSTGGTMEVTTNG